MSTAPTTTLRGFARLLGVRLSGVQKAIATGRLERSVGRDRRSRPLIVDVALARREWTENRDPVKARR